MMMMLTNAKLTLTPVSLCVAVYMATTLSGVNLIWQGENTPVVTGISIDSTILSDTECDTKNNQKCDHHRGSGEER